jgi:hypothetical protein
MKTLLQSTTALVLAITMTILVGCGKDKAPLGPFEPEVSNIQDNFQFQATALENVSTSVTYDWENTGISANIDQSCEISSGAAAVTVLDADGTQVYVGNLQDDGSFSSAEGVTGMWSVRVDIYNVYGTLNFRVQKP